jgi:hypothetical protein
MAALPQEDQMKPSIVFTCRTFGMWGFAMAVWAAELDMLLALGLCASAAALFTIADWFR